MNDPNKAIQVNLSSLLSLKAELLRKQTEVNKAKASQIQTKEYEANKSQYTSSTASYADDGKRVKKERPKEVEKRDDVIIYEHEDSEMLEKSKRVLEAKSKFYERMSRSGGKLNSDDNCLVLFNRKRQEQRSVDSDEKCTTNPPQEKQMDSDSDLSSSDNDFEEKISSDLDEDWVEYIDCLGRTRKCLRTDLEIVKKRDSELAASMPERLDQTKANWMIDAKGSQNGVDDMDNEAPIGPMPTDSIFGDNCSLMSKHDEQRANWERKEQENLDKADVHYQDVFFDEARQHGVGYYAFSTDEEERKKQQRELEESRQRTIEEQKHRDQLRVQREKIIAERVRSAKNRQRARLGLPPLEEDEAEKSKLEKQQKETKEERKARKQADKLKRKQEKEEQKRDAERQRHIRPWDKQKQDAFHSQNNDINEQESEAEPKWMYKPERLPMSQEEWNEKKRAERIPQFAPLDEQTHTPKRTNFTSMPPPMPPVSTSADRAFEKINPLMSSLSAVPTDTFVNFQTTKPNKQFRRRNYGTEDETAEEQHQRQGATIPPPESLYVDHSFPPHAKKPKSTNELERSIEAGLRFLRDNSDQGFLTTKSSWTAKADY